MSQALEKDIYTKLLKKKPSKLAIACSAGADSTALFSLIHKISKSLEQKPKIAICHINYNLRDTESLSEESFLQNLAKKNGAEFFVYYPKKTEKIKLKVGVQAWARQERYQFFSELANKGWTIALAHTKDDLFENIFMRLARGTSPIAAKGMSETHGAYWRPLLEANKKDLMNWLKNEGIPWKEDSSNQSVDYTRNRFRHEIIPAIEKIYPSAKNHFIRFAEQSHELAKFGREEVLKELKKYQENFDNTVSVPLTFFMSLDSSLIHLALVHIISELTNGTLIPESKTLNTIEKLIRKAPEKSPQVQLTTNLFYRVKRGQLLFGKNLQK